VRRSTCFITRTILHISIKLDMKAALTKSISVWDRSRWPRGLRHELSSVAWTLGSWVRILLKAWMSVCAFILCLCWPVCRYRPCDGLITRPRSPTVCVKKDYGTEKEARAQQRAAEPLMYEFSLGHIDALYPCFLLNSSRIWYVYGIYKFQLKHFSVVYI
jgi:hypothetical protein